MYLDTRINVHDPENMKLDVTESRVCVSMDDRRSNSIGLFFDSTAHLRIFAAQLNVLADLHDSKPVGKPEFAGF